MRTTLGAVGLVTVLGVSISTAAVAAPEDQGLTPGQRDALAAGVQVADKGSTTPRSGPGSLNPYLANLTSLEQVDYAAWNERMRAAAQRRADSARYRDNRREALAASGAVKAPFVHDEEEPAASNGSNDTTADAEPIPGFGTAAAKNPRVRILGALADIPGEDPEEISLSEDNGSIPLADESGIDGSGAIETESVLGDGPHGSSGDDSNDFDFVAMDVAAGQSILASTLESTSNTDTVLGVYDADGTLLANNDEAAGTSQSQLTYTPEEPGTYYLLVAGWDPLGSFPNDPTDSGSGNGFASTGPYTLTASVQVIDRDFYALRLRPGDVVGASAEGGADNLIVTTPSGERRIGGPGTDASFIYPPNSPLPGGGNTSIAYVAEERGWYALEVAGSPGDYEVTVEGYRPGAETDQSRRTQTVLLDFAPGRVNTGIWGGFGASDVSPFASFLPRWGLPRSQARDLEARVLRTVRANVQREIQEAGLNPDVNVRVLDARGNEDLVGRENVSRIYVAGTIDQTGLPTIGIAQFIDPGNYGHEDQAIVLLDSLSEPSGPEYSLNTYMTPASDRAGFVARAVGNVTAHEIGHTLGNFHTDNENDVHNVMDQGGAGFADNLYGVGPDGIGGTADDENIRFQTDTYSPLEGFTGLEDTLNVTAWAYSGR